MIGKVYFKKKGERYESSITVYICEAKRQEISE